MNAGSPGPITRAHALWLALIILLGAILRFWALHWSLPDTRHPLATYHPDERINLNTALNADFLRGDFDIEFYNYGTLYFYLVHCAHIFGSGWKLIPTTPAPPAHTSLSPVQELQRLAPENAGLFLAGRIVTALLGTATVAAMFLLGHRAFGTQTGLLAALLYAVAPLAVVHAHFLTVDVPATFFVTLTLIGALRLLNHPARKDFVLAGVYTGLAAATRYNAGLVLVAPCVATIRATPKGPARRYNTALLIGAATLTFLIACPGIWINWDAFWNGLPSYPGSGLRYELLEHSRQGHGDTFLQTGPGAWYHLTVSLRYGLGMPLLLLAIAGTLTAIARRTPQDLTLIAFLAAYYSATSLSAVRFARYMLPLFPVLCVLAARWATTTGRERLTPPWRSVPPALGALTATSVGALITIPLLSAMHATDPRDAVARALETRAPAGASVAFARIPWFSSPPLSPFFGAPAPTMRAQAATHTSRFTLWIPQTEWDLAVLENRPDYVVVSDLETVHTVQRLRRPQAVRWMQFVQQHYRAETFAPPLPAWSVPLIGVSDPSFPEDLRYVVPTLSLFTRRQDNTTGLTREHASTARSETTRASSAHLPPWSLSSPTRHLPPAGST
ncbi:MAG: glycosyltransferase family 39 protein [Chloroherpetonaceae bacterium]|nr:glycosyltransferase family 39 protein [Chthonomonadaceae bacterium]MDW8208795.1 glycosyltransferase family 39 protein [Chloroherpetonaceae bacterium]